MTWHGKLILGCSLVFALSSVFGLLYIVTNKPQISTAQKISNLLEKNKLEKHWSIYDFKIVVKELDKLADDTKINVNWYIALIKHESGFKYWVKGRKNRNGSRDLGLMQINNKYLRAHCRSLKIKHCNPFVVQTALKIGTYILRACAKKFSGLQIIQCYNPRSKNYIALIRRVKDRSFAI